jgi:predicted PurR-regulated permease PerM
MGFLGIFIGPVLMALLVAIWREWVREIDQTNRALEAAALRPISEPPAHRERE